MTPISNLPGYYTDERGVWSVKQGAPRLLHVSGWRPRRATVRTSAGTINVWTVIATTSGVDAANRWAARHADAHQKPVAA